MLAAYEAALRQGAKDESEWNMMRQKLYAPPRPSRGTRRAGPSRAQAPVTAPRSGGMALVDVEALIARAKATDAQYGT